MVNETYRSYRPKIPNQNFRNFFVNGKQPGTLLTNITCFRLLATSVRACNVVCPLDTAAVTELWRLDLFSCTSSSFLCAGTLSPRGKCCYFLREVKSGVDKHLFQTVSLITSITLPLNVFFFRSTTRQCPKQKQLSTVENTKENLIHGKTKRQQIVFQMTCIS